MIDTLKKFKYLIIIVVVLVIAFIAYTIYTNGAPATDSASLQRTTADGSPISTTIPGTGSAVPNNELAKSFVDQLLAIQSINLKIAFFSDPVFLGLIDNHKGIDPQLIGRPNPFLPIGVDAGPPSNNYQDINGQVINSTTGFTSSDPSGTGSAINSFVNTTSSSTTKPTATTSTKTIKKGTTATSTVSQ